MSITSTTSRHIVLGDGVRLELLESVRGGADALDDASDDALAAALPRGGSLHTMHGERDDGARAIAARETLPLLLLHGFTGAAASWNELLPALGARRRALALSLPGHGCSDAPDDPSRYAAARVAEDVVEVVEALGIARVALLGYSMGARVALHVALAAPERIGALVLESGSPGIADAEERAGRRAADEALAADIETHGVEAFVDRWERLPLWGSQRQLSPAAREGLRAQRLAGSACGLANALRGLGAGATLPLYERLGELARIPTLLICGSLDEKYVRLAREMNGALPRSTVRVVQGAGHAVHLERPRELLGAVNEFLKEVESAAAPCAVPRNGSPLARG